MDLSNLEYKYEFKATPIELIEVGELKDVIEWIQYRLTVKTTYEGEEFEDFYEGSFRFTVLRDIQESYQSNDEEENVKYKEFAETFVDAADVTSATLMEWLGWDGSVMKSIRTGAINHLHDQIKATIASRETKDQETASITFVD